LSFPRAAVRGAQLTFQLIPAVDTKPGNELEEFARKMRDFSGANVYDPDGALNHTMMYLCMGIDDQQGYFKWERPATERDGRVTVMWPGVGRQPIFGMINEEIRRHARREGASFMENPIWSFLNLRRLITAHPLGGCPMGDDFTTGAVDQFGRVFSGEGTVHDGLYVSDGSVVPAALGVNPFLTISALAERTVARKIRAMNGDAYEKPKVSVGFSGLDPRTAINRGEVELERIFEAAPSLPMAVMANSGARKIDTPTQTILNDEYWKGFFPKGQILHTLAANLYTGFKKKFTRKGTGLVGITSDTDGVINARNTLEEIEIKKQTGDLKPGKYILLRYVDPPWQGFYDIFKVINQNLLIGRVYLGSFPNGTRMFTFPMSRLYNFDQMTVEDHAALYAQGATPTAADVEGVWQMDVISNANHASAIAFLSMTSKPDGRVESRYQLMGLMEGLVVPSFAKDHFQLNDFTTFHDEIRKVSDDLLIGKYVTDLPIETPSSIPASLGLFHRETTPDGKQRLGFYYILKRSDGNVLPENRLLAPLLDMQLPRGIGMTFKEEMVGWYVAGGTTPSTDRKGDLTIAASVDQNAPTNIKFNLTMEVKDVNDFVDAPEHEANLEGTITFDSFAGAANVTFPVDSHASRFNYLRVNPQTGEAEMNYYLEFTSNDGRRYSLDGRKFMQKDETAGRRGVQELLFDYTTLYAHVREHTETGLSHLGTALLKFRTFENLAAVGNLISFLGSFSITGTDDLSLQTMARLRFLAFTGQFVQTEYDPLALPANV
jgi:hypothetical protein